MKTIRVFIASSVEDFKQERMELGDFIQTLNLVYEPQGFHIEWNKPENMSREFLPEGSQEAYNKKIQECDYFFLLVGRTIGMYTRAEFDLAQAQRTKGKSPKIYAFFLLKGGEFPSDEVMQLQRRLKYLRHYVTVYSNIDQVKLGIHLELVRGGAFAGSVVEMKPEKVEQFNPYKGNKPYIFANYSHRDSERVIPILEAMIKRGYRIWYDAGISIGENWRKKISDRIVHSAVYMLFLSSAAVQSHSVRTETDYALEKMKPICPIYLEPVELPAELGFFLSALLEFHLSNYDDLGEFMAHIDKDSQFAACRNKNSE